MNFLGFKLLAKHVIPSSAEFIDSAEDQKQLYEFILEELRKIDESKFNDFDKHDYFITKMICREQLQYIENRGQTYWEL